MINAGEQRLLVGIRGQGWTRQTGAVLPVVEGATGMEEVTGDELRNGRRPRGSWGFALRWFPSGFEVLGGSAGSWGVGRWR